LNRLPFLSVSAAFAALVTSSIAHAADYTVGILPGSNIGSYVDADYGLNPVFLYPYRTLPFLQASEAGFVDVGNLYSQDTNAELRLLSPGTSTLAWVNAFGRPDNNYVQTGGFQTLPSLLADANGTWQLGVSDIVQDENGDDVVGHWDYELDGSLTYPLSSIPQIVSDDMVSYTPFDGTVNFSMTGGSPSLFGPDSRIRARVYATDDFPYQLLEEVLLPIDATQFSPSADTTGVEYLRIELETVDLALPGAQLNFSNLRALTDGAPTIDLLPSTPLEVSAYRSATFLLPVPEPTSLATMGFAAAVTRRRRR
jgi:hypothetical protein